MVTPERRRRAVVVLVERFGVSERRACRVVGQHRSTQRRPPRARPEAEDKLRTRLREIARAHPRWGWKTAYTIVRREGWHVNRKRIQRLWRQEGLKRPQICRKRRRLGPTLTERLRATAPNQVWAIDFQFDETADQRRLKMANVVDEFTRECLAIRVGRSCDADQLIDVLEVLTTERRAPTYLRMDNGPEMIAWALRDWCRLSGTATTYIEPGAPWENPFVESFNGRFRDECLNIEDFGDLPEAQLVVEDWRIEYNTFRPHSALDGLTPTEFAERWAQEHQPELLQ
jgi:transposase InsO family protein